MLRPAPWTRHPASSENATIGRLANTSPNAGRPAIASENTSEIALKQEALKSTGRSFTIAGSVI
jgi:hypothetical protein